MTVVAMVGVEIRGSPTVSEKLEMPNLFVIGAEKCGTSSMHHYLGLHPEISMSTRKEPGYFARSSPDYRVIRHATSRDRYLSMFEAGATVRGEASPVYSAFPEVGGVPERIRAETDDPKFIYLVRDPIERIESALRHWTSFGRLDVGSGDLEVGEIPESHMVSRSRYMTQLRRYLEHFAAESILVVDSDRLRDLRLVVLEEIFEFLGVEGGFRHPGFREVLNPGEVHRVPPPIWRRLRSTRGAQAAVEVVPDRMRLRIREVRKKVNATAGTPLPEIVLADSLAESLRELLAPEVEALREFTGHDFPGWSV